jgi:hypothetical protein
VNEYQKDSNEYGSRVYEVRDVADFMRLACWLYSTEEVIFRGQRENWPLLPLVARDAGLVGAERQMLEEFKREAFPFLDRMELSSSDLRWLALAQHCGLPTRMMDWTKNPLAALWFAVREPPKDQTPAVVWVYSYQFSELITDSNGNDPFELSKVHVYFPEHVYRTIQAQEGVFTVHPRLKRFERFETIKDADLLLTRIEIPSERFAYMRYSLYRTGIHDGSLFPGLGGLAGKIKYKYLGLEDDPGPSAARKDKGAS